MPKVWVRIGYSENPHPVDPCIAYRDVFQAVSDADGSLDQMLFDTAGGVQYLLITTLREESVAAIGHALRAHAPEFLHSNLSALGELPSNGGASAA